jgi:hypothetical protein
VITTEVDASSSAEPAQSRIEQAQSKHKASTEPTPIQSRIEAVFALEVEAQDQRQYFHCKRRGRTASPAIRGDDLRQQTHLAERPAQVFQPEALQLRMSQGVNRRAMRAQDCNAENEGL